MRRWVVRSTFLCCALVAPLAAANIAAPHPDPSPFGALVGASESLPRVVHERLSLRCDEAELGPTCRFEARYTLRHQGQATRMVVAFYGRQIKGARIWVDGEAVSSIEPSAEEADRLDRALRATLDDRAPSAQSVQRIAFPLALSADATVIVQVSGSIVGGRTFYPEGYAWSAVKTRHPLLAGRQDDGSQHRFSYLVAPIRSFGGAAPRIELFVDCPGDWRVAILTTGKQTRALRGGRREGDRQRWRADVDAASIDTLELSVWRDGPVVGHGGPLLGVGGKVRGDTGLWLRFGYELAAPTWLAWQLLVETDLDRSLVVAPLVEVATPSLLRIIPSLGLGLGLPIEAKPETLVGVRLQASICWPVVGVVAAFDFFPALSDSERAVSQIALLAQLGI